MYLVEFGKGWLLAGDETWTILKTTAASISLLFQEQSRLLEGEGGRRHLLRRFPPTNISHEMEKSIILNIVTKMVYLKTAIV